MARLSVVGALDPGEMAQFQAGRLEFGTQAEAFLTECHKLNTVFALSLRPCEPDPRTKARLFAKIHGNSALWKGSQRGELVLGKLTSGLN